jgi:hypothetical protein
MLVPFLSLLEVKMTQNLPIQTSGSLAALKYYGGGL